jgi:hypothetical protein
MRRRRRSTFLQQAFMRLPSSAQFPPPSPANDCSRLVQWRADALAHARRRVGSRDAAPGRLAALLDHLFPLVLLVLALWAAGFRF